MEKAHRKAGSSGLRIHMFHNPRALEVPGSLQGEDSGHRPSPHVAEESTAALAGLQQPGTHTYKANPGPDTCTHTLDSQLYLI